MGIVTDRNIRGDVIHIDSETQQVVDVEPMAALDPLPVVSGPEPFVVSVPEVEPGVGFDVAEVEADAGDVNSDG